MSKKKERKSGNCEKCGIYRRSLHRDHIIPKCKGGSDTSENIQWLCANCHEDKTREDFLGFNLTPIRKPVSEETKARIGAGNRGKIISLETRAKVSKALKGRAGISRPHTAEARAKISAAQTGVPKLKTRGRPFTEDHRNRISAALTGKPKSEEHKRAINRTRTLTSIKRLEVEIAELKASERQ